MATGVSAILFFCTLVLLVSAQSCNIYTTRVDCGFVGISQQQCQQRGNIIISFFFFWRLLRLLIALGCCWNPSPIHDPYCFYSNAPSNNYYVCNLASSILSVEVDNISFLSQISSIMNTANGLSAVLSLQNTTSNIFGSDIGPLQMDVFFETGNSLERCDDHLFSPLSDEDQRLHVKIYDPKNQRWEVPQAFIPRSPPPSAASSPDYRFSYVSNPFGFAVTRGNATY